MSGGWIKMGVGLRRHPKVVRIASALKADKLRVIGGLHAVWCVFDEHSADGFLDGYTLSAMDEEVGWDGFSAAMVAIGWLVETDSGLLAPDYDEHNGPSAKRRAQETERKRTARASMSASDADKLRSREEKRREEKKRDTPRAGALVEDPGFVAFWAAYPSKASKKDALKAWQKLSPGEALQASILKALAWQSQGEDWRKEGGRFVPRAATYLNGERWLDEPPKAAAVVDIFAGAR